MAAVNAPAMHTDPLILAWIELDAAAQAVADIRATQIPNPVLGGFTQQRQEAKLRKPEARLSAAILNFGLEHDAALGR
jgi:hypothetical protein